MPNPRNTIAFDDIRAERTTYRIDGSTITFDPAVANGSSVVGRAVTLSGDGVVALAADGDAIVGKLIQVESDGACAVQDEGYLTLPAGQGATITRGTAIVGALGPASAKGYIRSVNTATAAELGKCRGMIVTTGDPTKTTVKL